MIDTLVGLLILVIVLGIVLYLLLMLIDMLPIEGSFKQIAKILLILICVLVVLARALPLLGIHVLT